MKFQEIITATNRKKYNQLQLKERIAWMKKSRIIWKQNLQPTGCYGHKKWKNL